MNALPTLNKLLTEHCEAANRVNRGTVFARIAQALIANGAVGTDPAAAFFVPGRIEVLGKHTDYAGGRSITCAVDRGFAMAATLRNDRVLNLRDLRSGETVAFDFSASLKPASGTWANYPMTVAQRLAHNFDLLWCGANIAFQSDLPLAAGLSSSSAFMVATFLVISTLNKLDQQMQYRHFFPDLLQLAEYLGCMENGRTFRTLEGTTGVGTHGGSEDQTAILCSEPDHLKCYCYQPMRQLQSLRFPEHYSFVVAASGVTAEKTGDALLPYNRLADQTSEIVAHASKRSSRQFRSLAEIYLAGPSGYPRFQELSPQLQERWAHFDMEENVFLPAALSSLAAGDMTSFASAINASHASASKLLGNQIPETDGLVQLARQHGALAASAFGAGFGGSVYALIVTETASQFSRAWLEAYQRQFPVAGRLAAAFLTRPSHAAFQVL